MVKMTGSEKQINWATELKETLKFAKEILNGVDDQQDEFNYKPLIEEGYKKAMEEENAGKVINTLKGLQKHRLETEKMRIERGNTRSMKGFIIGLYLMLTKGGHIEDDVF